ncbi:glucosidase 2 subunit beta-like [Magnolia sinica]|uniref:glucosidase 2 subunit beta-like n=1 Tax=Magnolia sinica TaxID=86752 RepID=UPI00265A365C|nr:glucosidase 2 subunit beta-like [Magnolia sinica]
MKSNLRCCLLLAFLCLISIPISASAFSEQLLGVAPEDEKYFQSNVIECKDGSGKFNEEKLNDEFCDCPDGTDEPGTSACPDGRFYCRNVGHTPLTLFSSRVNDGICDCCDGTDEYDGKVKCPNTCWEAGKVARDKLMKKIVTYQEGVTIRKQEVEKAKQAIVNDEVELSKLKDEEKILKGLVEQLRERKEQIEEAEEQERREKEKEEESLREAERNANKQDKQHLETPRDQTNEVEGKSLEELGQHAEEDSGDAVVEDETGHESGTGSVTSRYDVLKEEQEKSENTEGLSREELGRLVASRWTGKSAGQQASGLDGAKGVEHEHNPEIPDVTEDDRVDDDYKDHSSRTDGDGQKDGDDEMEGSEMDDELGDEDYDPLESYDTNVEDKVEFSDVTNPSSQSWLDKIQQTVRNILQAVPLFKTPVDKSEAALVRKQYDDSSQKLFKLQSRISSLTEKLKNDYGMEKEFYSFYDTCFENKQNKYVYKVCPYKEASQVEGYSTTHLGQWDTFKDSYKVMQFTNGDSCWNGPNRSLKVTLLCGLNNKLTDIDEPSRCEYVALLSTPALCLEEKLKELQHELDLMNMNQPQSHDEL